jgi:eukaryotic-like serine/threonine-protein kinase
MPLLSGVRLGIYEIVELIGMGGMGEVYRARDARLNRDVAVKILPSHVAGDPDRLARFRREAQVLASLNHSNVGSIYGFEESGGVQALILELVDGPTLADRIAEGPVPLDEALQIAVQIAHALEAAHERGIVHRDLKPANIKVRSDGVVKVLDFGLAKALANDGTAPESSATITSPALTGLGVILGTAAYMSPEQARGKEADKRSDVWAFGCVLFEMLTAKRAFEGSEVSDTLASILKSDPDWTALPQRTSSGIRRVLRRCLEKDPRRRFHDVADVRLELEDLPAREVAATSSTERRLRERAAWAVAVVSLVLLGALAAYVALKPAPAASVHRFQVSPPPGCVFGGPGQSAGISGVAVSPDGTRLVFVATDRAGKSELWMRAFDSFDAFPLTGTDGAIMPFWSPDSRWIGFFTGSNLMKIPAAGGSPQRISDVESLRWCGTWGSGGDIVFSSGNPPRLYRIQDRGGVAVPLPAQAASADPRLPYFLPDGRTLLYLGRDPSEGIGVYVTSTAEGSASKRLVSSDLGPAYDPSGFLLFARGGSLLRQRFDPVRLEVSGDTTQVAEGVGYGFVPVSVSTNGVLAFQPRIGLMSQFAWFDRTGRLLETVGAPGKYRTPHLSPDGNRLVYTNLADGNLWILDMRRRIASTFTTGPGIKVSPVWSPDGGTIFYGYDKQTGYGGNVAIFEKSTSAANEEKVFFNGPTTNGPAQISRDGKWLLYFANPEGEGVGDIYALPMTGDRTPQRIVHSPFSDVEPQLSPDGKFIAYVSTETGESEVYVQSFPAGERWPISNTGGRQPLWRADGEELYFVSPRGTLYAVEIKPGSKFDYGTPHPLFEMRAEVYLVRNSYIPSPDGSRFLVNMALDTTPPIHVVTNWTAGLKN